MIPSGGSDRSVQSLILEHLRRYPLMEPADLYKLLFQAAMGSSHDMPDPGIARERLLREMQEMGEGPEEALLDGISPSGDIARVHLRPWRGSGFDTEALLEAFVRTAKEHDGSNALLETYLHVALRMAADAALGPGLREDVAGEVFDRMRLAGYPAARHSRAFRTSYRPAYRVVATRFLEMS